MRHAAVVRAISGLTLDADEAGALVGFGGIANAVGGGIPIAATATRLAQANAIRGWRTNASLFTAVSPDGREQMRTLSVRYA